MLKSGKKVKIIAGGLFVLLGALCASEVMSNVGGAPVARSGAPGEATCATSSCHSGTVNSGTGSITILSDAPGNTYTPGQTYTITTTVEQSDPLRQRYGFEVLSALGTSGGTEGSTVITNGTETQLKSFSTKRYVTHRQAGTSGPNGERTWTFEWTAPNPGVGAVTFYGAGNAANNNGSRTGDDIYTTSLTLFDLSVGVEDQVAGYNAFQAWPTMVSDRMNIRLENSHLDELEYAIVDMNGREVWRQKQAVSGFNFRETLNLNHLQAGIYLLSVRGKGLNESVKFVKM